MVEDIFFNLRGNISEFTDKYFFDYERETVLLEVHPDYLDEIFKIINADLIGFDIVFVKALEPDIVTVVACIPQIVDILHEIEDEDGEIED
jgi:hypothetical protein